MLRATVVLSDQVSWLGVAMLVEPWRIANRLDDHPSARWELVTWSGEPATASNGMPIPVSGSVADADPDVDVVLLYTSEAPETTLPPELLQWLASRADDDVMLGGLDTGAEALAAAGLLTGHLAALHFEEIPAFRERHRDLELAFATYNIDERRATCAGGTATLDFSLALLSRFASDAIAARTAEVLIYDRRSTLPTPDLTGEGWLDPRLGRAIHSIAHGLADPGVVRRAATAAGLSERQLLRLFRSELGTTPLRFATDLRVRRARTLLEETRLPVTTIAFACGYGGVSEFARAFRRATGLSPTEART